MAEKDRRGETRKFKRIFVNFGTQSPKFRAPAIQISTRGLFLQTNQHVYPPGSKLFIQISTPNGLYTATGIVRYAKKVPHLPTHHERPGMGVELLSVPQELQEYLASL